MTHNKKYILVAEDEPFLAKMYNVKLSAEGFDILVVPNGEELLKSARERKPDLILLDLIMPVKDGFDTLRDLKQDKDLQEIPVIVISNLCQQSEKDTIFQYGIKEYLVKADMTVHEIVDVVKKYVG